MKDIKEILKFLRELPKMIGMLNMSTEKVDVVQSIREIVYEWKGYKDLEEQGKLLKLPCAVEDAVYTIYSDEDGAFIEEPKVKEVSTHRIWIDSEYFDYDDWKNCFPRQRRSRSRIERIMNIKVTINKLQKALIQRGYIYKINTYQFYRQ